MHIDANAVRVVAEDTRSSFASYDLAILDAAKLSVTMLEANALSEVPARDSQIALRAIHESTGHLISARASMVRLVGHLNAIKLRSDQAPMNVGCPGETPLAGSLVPAVPQELAVRD
ncbi:hypothetical protein [Blastomonas sp.]|uniref:hypothetical protein n=1 Tax=Blastomonas sp. TaxID=1909299 RepID=UPI002624A65D|nr:hypothetical protein [Blastomonas sp.]MDM7957528.1 hypothetical protein [Blastomonas sp.]